LGFLLDTNVVSEARKGSRANAGVMRWLSSVAVEDLYVSVLVIGEIRQGIEGLRGRDSIQADHLETWLSGLRCRYADRILPMDLVISSRDGLMMATAKVRGMTFVTRNTADVEGTGVRVLNPFSP
jgi:toxin FitB